jgi:hypothetical protein
MPFLNSEISDNISEAIQMIYSTHGYFQGIEEWHVLANFDWLEARLEDNKGLRQR